MMLAQAIGYNSEEDVIQNLKDAGCDQETIERFMNCMEQDDLTGQLRLMEEHRKCILDRVHKEEKQIDCLDYLVYQIGRNNVDVKKPRR
ncbi:MAG: hypothetical protein NC305_18420 [Lachnospiraceae bacterium]|nr:hypothetical protein [Muribaculaceae bacterium]MCM1412496.1 hypothetical protein [Lachnospiraceae bacterium]